MAVAKVTLNGTTLIDLTSDTVATDNLIAPNTAHNNAGIGIVGTASGGSAPNLQAKTKSYTPSETAQSETVTADSGYDGLSSVEVTVGAISNTYVGTGITRRSSSDLTTSGATVTVPPGYYSSDASASITNGALSDPTVTYISAGAWTGSITVDNNVKTSGYLASSTYKSKTFNLSEVLPVQAAKTITPTESIQTAVDQYKWTTGAITVDAIPSTYVGSDITRRDDTDLTASGATVTVPAGYYASQETKSVASGTAGTPTATKGTVSNHSVTVTPSVTNTTGYITGGTVNGTAVTVSASELVSGTLSVTSSGTKDVTNYASASIPSGTEGTPTATKGTVSNHSVSVTPSVTNTNGFISGGTHSGTAVTVSASELVSGSQTISDNGTVNVTNLASVTVDIPFVTYYTGTSDPSSSQGNNGDIYLKVVN